MFNLKSLTIKNLILCCGFLISGSFSHIMAEPKNLFADQPEATPITITDFHARGYSDYIYFSLKTKPKPEKKVLAWKLQIAVFDAFHELIDIANLYSGDQVIGWQGNVRTSGNRYRYHGTTIAWVDKVRFEDGTVWHSDKGKILTELKKLQKDFTLEDLKEKKNRLPF